MQILAVQQYSAPAPLLFAFWLMISGGKGALFAVGFVAVAIATWTSLRLLPDGGSRIRPFAAVALAFHILRQSVVAGLGVACARAIRCCPYSPALWNCHYI